MSDIQLGITLRADGSGLVGQVRLSKAELDKLGQGAKGAGRDMGVLERGSRMASEQMGKLRNMGRELHGTFFSLRGALAAVGLGALAKSFLTAADTSERYRVRLKVLLGSVEEGNRLFQEMQRYASTVPHEFEQIMGAATTLAGIMKGGVDEISAWMPLIGDLASATGLSVEETTAQVQRMLSAGAASADLFQQRGVLAMLGFQQGVSYSAAETRQRLAEEWMKMESRWRGATDEMAKTWQGRLSMIADKWFGFRNQIMDAGLFDYIKALAATFDIDLGAKMEDNKALAKTWAEAMINGIESVIRAMGVLDTIWRRLELGVKVIILGLGRIELLRKQVMGASAVAESGDLATMLDNLSTEINELLLNDKGVDADALLAKIRENLNATAAAADHAAGRVQNLKGVLSSGGSAGDGVGDSKLDPIGFDLERFSDEIIDIGDQVVKQQEMAKKKLEEMGDSAARVWEATRTPLERYNAELQQLGELLLARKIDHDTYSRAVEQAQGKLDDLGLGKAGETSMDDLKNAIQGMGRQFNDTLTEMATGGKASFSGLISSMIKDMARLAFQKNITDPLFGALEGLLGGGGGGGSGGGIGSFLSMGMSFLGSLFGGGIAGEPAPLRAVDPRIFLGATRYHRGGLAGDEVPAILQRGERVLSRDQTRALGGNVYHVNIDARDADPGVEQRLERKMNDLARNGILPAAIKGATENLRLQMTRPSIS